MCKWQSITISDKGGKIPIPAQVFQDACEIILQAAQNKQTITYTEIMDQLKKSGHRKISRRTIGKILGEVNDQVSQNTNPSIYPSAIVILSGGNRPGGNFWGVSTGTNPPSGVVPSNRTKTLQRYRNDIFNKHWSCNC